MSHSIKLSLPCHESNELLPYLTSAQVTDTDFSLYIVLLIVLLIDKSSQFEHTS